MFGPGPPGLTWRTFMRLHAPALVTDEASAKVLDRFRALYTTAVRALRRWLRGAVSGGRQRTSRRDVMPLAHPCKTMPTLSVADIADRVQVSERSPPGLRSSPDGEPLADDLTIAVGPAEGCLASWAMDCGDGPHLRWRHVQGPTKKVWGTGTSRRTPA